MRRLFVLIPLLLVIPILTFDFLYNFLYGKLSPKGYPKHLYSAGEKHITKVLAQSVETFPALLLARLDFQRASKHIAKYAPKAMAAKDSSFAEMEDLAYNILKMYYFTFFLEAAEYLKTQDKNTFLEKNSEKQKYIMEHCSNYEKLFSANPTRVADIQLLMVCVLALLNKPELVSTALKSHTLLNYNGEMKGLHTYLTAANGGSYGVNRNDGPNPIVTSNIIEKTVIDNNLLGLA